MPFHQSSRFKPFDANIASEVFDSEVVLVNLMSGVYFSIMGSAAEIWIRLMAGYSMQEVIEDLKMIYGTHVDSMGLEADLMQFLDTLASHSLILEDVNVNKSNSITVRLDAGDYTTPKMEVFQDMRDILLLDPVHDVNTIGWPSKPGNVDS